jgi:hypothetical protein
MARCHGDPADPRADTYADAMQGPPRRPPTFRPRATLALFYFFGFFFLFAFLLAAPALWRGFQAVSADASQWEAAQTAVQHAIAPRLWIALVAAAAATLIGGRTGVLPGSR